MSDHADDTSTPVQTLALRAGDRLVDVQVDAIDWIESAGNYVVVHIGRAALLHRSTLEGLHRRLGHHRFVGIRRSTLVRVTAIRSCEPIGKGSYGVVLRNGTRLLSSRHFLPELRRIFGPP